MVETSEALPHRKLITMVRNWPSPKIVLVGDFMLDSYVYGDAERISPEAPVPVLRTVRREHRVGGAGSVANDLIALGARVTCIGVVGEDESGTHIRTQLASLGADVSHLVTAPDRPTTTKERLVGLAQHRHPQQLLRVDHDPTEPLGQDTVNELIDRAIASLDNSVVLCLEDYAKGVIDQRLCHTLVERANQMGVISLVDPSPKASYETYRGCTCVTPNRIEAYNATGIAVTTTEAAEQASRRIVESYGIGSAVVTLDREGAFVADNRGLCEHVPTRPRSVYDNTGAGDMVLATLAMALGAGATLVEAAMLANIAGGLEVQKFGAVEVSRDEIISDLWQAHREKSGKLRTIEHLVDELREHRRADERIVFTNGCFDILHPGHVQYLEFAASQGDVLVVGVNSDDSVHRLKGPSRPINCERDRVRMLAALESVDYVVVFDEPDPAKLIEQVRPDVLIKGEDWRDKGVVGQEFVESYGGEVVLAKLTDGHSTTTLIQRIIEKTSQSQDA